MDTLFAPPTASEIRARMEKAMSLPVGLASPLWMAFGAAAGAGVAFWWLTRLVQPAAAAASAAHEPTVDVLPAIKAAERFLPVAFPAIEPTVAPPPAEITLGEPDSAEIEALAAVAVPDTEPEPAPAVVEPETPDELTRMLGIGPRIADGLAARGVTRFAHIAAWTPADIARFDAEMNLRGRAVRDGWIEQAKRLAAEVAA